MKPWVFSSYSRYQDVTPGFHVALSQAIFLSWEEGFVSVSLTAKLENLFVYLVVFLFFQIGLLCVALAVLDLLTW